MDTTEYEDDTFDNTHDADCPYWQGAVERIDGCTCNPKGLPRDSDQFDFGDDETTMMEFTFERWRHGGWYVNEVRYPSGAVGCVSRSYPDGKWRIVCDRRPNAFDITYPSRQAAAQAEYELARTERTAERTRP